MKSRSQALRPRSLGLEQKRGAEAEAHKAEKARLEGVSGSSGLRASGLGFRGFGFRV